VLLDRRDRFGRRGYRPAAPRNLDVEDLDLVVHDARADAEQLGRVLLHPVRHPQRFDDGLTLDLLQRDARGRNFDGGRVVDVRCRGGVLADLEIGDADGWD